MKFRLIEEKIKTLKDGEIAPDGSVTMCYIHIKNDKSQRINFGDRFGQNIEPSGEYMNYLDNLEEINPNVNADYGVITFHNPLIVEYKNSNASGWKKDVSDMFGGKVNKELSQAIKDAGYDAVITWEIFRGRRSWSEIVNLCGEKL